ncbi:hypothetical protein ACFQDN_23590, partial [Pseudomonas asuensis]
GLKPADRLKRTLEWRRVTQTIAVYAQPAAGPRCGWRLPPIRRRAGRGRLPYEFSKTRRRCTGAR